jgi:uncharacterized FlgJ-related protein
MMLEQTTIADGKTYRLYPVDYETADGLFSVYIYALNRQHAYEKLQELKSTAQLREGELVEIGRIK